MATLGLVTVLYKSDDVLEDFFKSLSLQTYADYNLYLIDNSPSAATDEVVGKLIKTYMGSVNVIHHKNNENEGVAKGNNQGITMALNDGAEYVILLNNDIDFSQPNILSDMVACAANKNEGLIVPKIFYHNTRIIWMAGGDILKYRGYTSHYGENRPDAEVYSKEAHFNYSPTCFMLISKKVFDKVGLMDERYFVYYDDTDFIARCLQKNFRVFLMPQLEIFHKVGMSTGGGESAFTIYYQNRNRIYFIKKNFSLGVQFIALFYSLVTRIVRYASYDKLQRKSLLDALKAGFNMKVIR